MRWGKSETVLLVTQGRKWLNDSFFFFWCWNCCVCLRTVIYSGLYLFSACSHWSYLCPFSVTRLPTRVNEYSSRSWTLQLTSKAGAYWDGPDWEERWLKNVDRCRRAELNASRMLSFSVPTGGMRDLIMTAVACAHPCPLYFPAGNMSAPIWMPNNVFGVGEPEISQEGMYCYAPDDQIWWWSNDKGSETGKL